MPITKSATKKMRQDVVKTSRNKVKREQLRDTIKSVEDAVKTGAVDKLVELVKAAFKMIDKAAKWNIIHENNAARKKSLLAKLTNQKKEQK